MKKLCSVLFALVLVLMMASVAVCAAQESTAVVGEADMVWVLADNGNVSFWLALDNSDGQFWQGSVVRVSLLTEEENPRQFSQYDLPRGCDLLIDLQVCSPDGLEYKTSDRPISFYMQIPDDWDRSSFKILSADDVDEPVVISYDPSVTTPTGERGALIRCELHHPSCVLALCTGGNYSGSTISSGSMLGIAFGVLVIAAALAMLKKNATGKRKA